MTASGMLSYVALFCADPGHAHVSATLCRHRHGWQGENDPSTLLLRASYGLPSGISVRAALLWQVNGEELRSSLAPFVPGPPEAEMQRAAQEYLKVNG